MHHIHLLERRLRLPIRRAGAALATLAAGAIAAGLAAAPPASAATPSTPPPVTFLTSHGPAGHGDIFITPTGASDTYANGPEILDRHGKVVWFHSIPAGQTAADFRT